MNVVDSCGWLEYFEGSANALFFTPPIEDVAQLIVPTICIAEVYKKVLFQRGENLADRAVAQMGLGRIIELDLDLAMDAAKLSVEFKLPLADSIILATARMHRAVIWTQDAHLRQFPEVKFKAAPSKSKFH